MYVRSRAVFKDIHKVSPYLSTNQQRAGDRGRGGGERAKYLFADFASLGSFIVSRDFFLSQYGTLVGFGGDLPVAASVAAGWHFFEIAYLKDASTNSNSDKADFTFAETGGNSYIAGFSMIAFRPTKVVNALTGEEWQAQGNVHVSPEGNVTVKGTLEMKSLTVQLADITAWGTANDFIVGVDTTVGGRDISGLWNFRCTNNQTIYLPTNKYYYLGQRVILYNSSPNLGGGNGTYVICGD
ncbi:MAG: hypothetical protein K6B13_08105, partial [Prevotella sp.]|nr:hypothetical protein [Prevotella sp.]